jgi:YVTN family beta-propeller protein
MRTAARFATLLLFSIEHGALQAAEEPAQPSHASDDYFLYVSNERSDDMTVIDGATRQVVRTLAVGKRPRGIHVSPDGKSVFVAVSGSPRMGPGADTERGRKPTADKTADGIAQVDPASNRVIQKVFVGSDPEQFALSPDGRSVFVSNEDESSASCWDLATGKQIFQTRVSEEPEGVAFLPQHNEVYITCEEKGELYVLRADTGAEIARLKVPPRPRSIAFSPDGSRAYVASELGRAVTVVDTTRHEIADEIKVPGEKVLPMGVVASADGQQLFVSGGHGNCVVVIDRASKGLETIPVGQRPWGLVLSPDGALLYSANGLSNDVSVIDLHARKEISRIAVGQGPWGVAIGPKIQAIARP